jgi:hypothetical protein
MPCRFFDRRYDNMENLLDADISERVHDMKLGPFYK